MTRRRRKGQKKNDLPKLNRKQTRIWFLFIGVLILIAVLFDFYSKSNFSGLVGKAETYKPLINPLDFTNKIENRYLSYRNQKTYDYEKQSKAGFEKSEITIVSEVKEILGVKTTTLRKKDYLDNEPTRETFYYLAQNSKREVWLFGVEEFSLKNGNREKNIASWLAGEVGSQPGVWMSADMKSGQLFHLGYLSGQMETTSEVVSIDETVSVPAGTYTNCLKTFNSNASSPSFQENNYYCPEVGGLTLSVNLIDDTRLELVPKNDN